MAKWNLRTPKGLYTAKEKAMMKEKEFSSKDAVIKEKERQKQMKAQRDARYRKNNPEKRRALALAWRAKNPEKYAAATKSSIDRRRLKRQQTRLNRPSDEKSPEAGPQSHST